LQSYHPMVSLLVLLVFCRERLFLHNVVSWVFMYVESFITSQRFLPLHSHCTREMMFASITPALIFDLLQSIRLPPGSIFIFSAFCICMSPNNSLSSFTDFKIRYLCPVAYWLYTYRGWSDVMILFLVLRGIGALDCRWWPQFILQVELLDLLTRSSCVGERNIEPRYDLNSMMNMFIELVCCGLMVWLNGGSALAATPSL
jgi:hypothetical protein